jgi:hypothetical protein
LAFVAKNVCTELCGIVFFAVNVALLLATSLTLALQAMFAPD